MKTLLQDFIDKKMSGYIPPASKREGGLSKQKYKTALLFLTNKRQEDIAKEVNASFGLVRKWRTEKLFLDTIENHCCNFIALFVENLAEFKPDLFADLPQYHPMLLTEITTTMFSLLNDQKGLILSIHYLLILKRYVPSDVIGDTILANTQKAVMFGIIKKIKESLNDPKVGHYLDLLEKII